MTGEYEIKVTVARTDDGEEAERLMDDLTDEIRERYQWVEPLYFETEPRREVLGPGPDGIERHKVHPPRFKLVVEIFVDPSETPFHADEMAEMLTRDIDALPGFASHRQQNIPLDGLRHSDLANYLGETIGPRIERDPGEVGQEDSDGGNDR